MIPAFHDYSLEPKIMKCGDLLYYTWFSRYVCMPAMLYEIYNREVHGTKQQHIVRGMFSLVVLLNTYI